jgi:Protein of unknown function (DUF3750)
MLTWIGLFLIICLLGPVMVYVTGGARLWGDWQTASQAPTDQAPDAQWFGAQPWLLREVRGAAAEVIIAALPRVVASDPYADCYRVWPGPNSNTLVNPNVPER